MIARPACRSASAAVLALAFATPLAVPAAAAPAEGSAYGTAAYQSTFCEGTYALCIKAPCSAIPTLERLGTYGVEHALCSCDVVEGWSMGPGSCVDRGPMKQGGRTYLISTYSNLYNASEQTLACDSEQTLWAWCYGAPCVVDGKDPSKAVCTCPVETGPARTLGGDCRQSACSGIWSAASPAGDVYANRHYYEIMRKDHPDVTVNPPAAACPAQQAAPAGGQGE